MLLSSAFPIINSLCKGAWPLCWRKQPSSNLWEKLEHKQEPCKGRARSSPWSCRGRNCCSGDFCAFHPPDACNTLFTAFPPVLQELLSRGIVCWGAVLCPRVLLHASCMQRKMQLLNQAGGTLCFSMSRGCLEAPGGDAPAL